MQLLRNTGQGTGHFRDVHIAPRTRRRKVRHRITATRAMAVPLLSTPPGSTLDTYPYIPASRGPRPGRLPPPPPRFPVSTLREFLILHTHLLHVGSVLTERRSVAVEKAHVRQQVVAATYSASREEKTVGRGGDEGNK